MYVAKVQATEIGSVELGFWVLLTDRSDLCHNLQMEVMHDSDNSDNLVDHCICLIGF